MVGKVLKVFGPKVLGDFFESTVGAILVDNGFDLEEVWSDGTVFISISNTLDFVSSSH